MSYTVRIARKEGWQVSPRGVPMFFPQGDYEVPDKMSIDLGRRCLSSGIGKRIDDIKKGAPETKSRKRKKKRNGKTA